MRNPFLRSAGARFADPDEVLEVAREAARRMASSDPDVDRVLVFGSFARGDYGVRSDLDLLIVLRRSTKPLRDRVADFLSYATDYPTDVFPYTVQEIEARLAEGDPFITRALREALQIYPEPEPHRSDPPGKRSPAEE